ncbi:MAG TPA: family 78 glycoside hydrolase catalytic domain [Terracidiphilus sp.]|nr:family 78 glycoside hydrolase catalytic domain [Terracidiphilus sp.]
MKIQAGAMAWVLAGTMLLPLKSIAEGPAHLEVDNLRHALGIDDASPSFSWQLDDPTRGARQTGYEVQVATSEAELRAGKADVWVSGRVASGQSLNVKYAGPALKASTRYYWRVKVWGVGGKAYAPDAVNWWETGLMTPDAWRADWIGYETPEEAAVRHARAEWVTVEDAAPVKGDVERIAYRTHVTLAKPVRKAVLYATGEDTVSAWVNGTHAMEASALPPYEHLPWKKFVRADVTGDVAAGTNTIAIEAVHYTNPNDGAARVAKPPMIATLYVEYSDETTATFGSDATWKANTDAAPGWQHASFNDAGWPAAVTAASAGHPWIPDSVKALRHVFDEHRPVKSARLYATALGMYEMFLNGRRVGEQVIHPSDEKLSEGAPVMAPGWTDYRERVLYQTYDVTALLKQGRNAVGALLAPGWYETPLEWLQEPNNYGVTPPALRAELRIEHTDGSVEWVTTTPAWQARRSSILHSELYDGESQDARRREPGWDTADFSAHGWKQAMAITPAPVRIEAQEFQPIRVERELHAVEMTEPKPDVYIYDFGQNQAGVERVRVSAPAGTTVRLRFGEILNADGTLYTENLRTAKATDTFTLAGKGVEEFTPQFTYHGYRYAELTGLPAAPGKDAVTALVLHTDAPFAARMKTGDAMINQLLSNIEWGQRSNFMSVPTDCPQRDERLGWMGDAEVFWRAASYNMNLAAFTRKFAGDMRGTQAGTPFYGIYSPGTSRENMGLAAGWSDAGVILPWTSWLQNGDTSVIDENWAAMTKYLAAIDEESPNGLWEKNLGNEFGDWLSPEGKTNQVLIATASWAYDVTLMREMARATGRTADEEKYARLFEKIRAAFEEKFVHSDGYVAGADNGLSQFGRINNPNAKSKGGDTQTGYALTLQMNLVPDDLRAKVAKRLVDKIAANHGLLGTGFLGTPYLLQVLTRTGHADVAYELMLNTAYPSWGYLVDHGATTMWERWNGDKMKSDPSMNSYNHYAYGAVAAWLYGYAAGVDATPMDAGFHTVVLHPVFSARLGSVEFRYPSAYGVIASDWKVSGSTVVWHVTIPANATGWIPESEAGRYHLKSAAGENGITRGTGPNGHAGLRLEAGGYQFTGKLE